MNELCQKRQMNESYYKKKKEHVNQFGFVATSKYPLQKS